MDIEETKLLILGSTIELLGSKESDVIKWDNQIGDTLESLVSEVRKEARYELAVEINKVRPALYIREQDMSSKHLRHYIGSMNEQCSEVAKIVLEIIRENNTKYTNKQ